MQPGGRSVGVCEIRNRAARRSSSIPTARSRAEAVAAGKRIVAAGGLDVGGIEYLETRDGRLIFYDVNANSNLRPPIGQAFGFDPFERVVDFLAGEIRSYEGFLRFAGLRGRIEAREGLRKSPPRRRRPSFLKIIGFPPSRERPLAALSEFSLAGRS